MIALRRCAWTLLGALVLIVAGCGPGVGGTGTGYGAEPGLAGLAYAGAQPANVCSGPLFAVLQCSAPAVGVTLVGECASAAVDGDEVVLDVLCGGWVFAGRWGIGQDGIGRYYGLIGTDPLVPPSEPGAVEVQVDGTRILVWLRDAQGALVAGPLALAPAQGAAWRRSE